MSNTDKIINDDSQIDASIERELAAVFNRFSAENVSGTPDFVLAKVALDAVKAFNEAVHLRANWRHETVAFEPWKTLLSHPAEPIVDEMDIAHITGDLEFKHATQYMVDDALASTRPFNPPVMSIRSKLDALVHRLSHQDQDAKETYIREVMTLLDIKENDLKMFVLDEIEPVLETDADLFSNSTTFRMTSKFRLRPKTRAELDQEIAAERRLGEMMLRKNKLEDEKVEGPRIEFDDLQEASDAKGFFMNILTFYGVITMADVLTATAERDVTFNDIQWGWSSLDGIELGEDGKKYYLQFPIEERL